MPSHPACDPVPRKSAHATLNFTRSPKPKLRLRRRLKRRDLRARRRVLRVTASVGELRETMFWAAPFFSESGLGGVTP